MAHHPSSMVPLRDVLPSCTGRFLLVQDSIETDGRFLLHAVVGQALQLNKSDGTTKTSTTTNMGTETRKTNVLWLVCGSSTEALIVTSLKKMGYSTGLQGGSRMGKHIVRDRSEQASSVDKQGSSSTGDDDDDDGFGNTQPLCMHSITEEIGSLLLHSSPPLANEDNTIRSSPFDPQLYAKHLYRRTRKWVQRNQQSSTASLIVLDDVTSLSSLLGDRITYFLILSLKGLIPTIVNDNDQGSSSTRTPVGLMVRSASDIDQDNGSDEVPSATGTRSTSTHAAGWVGAGGTASFHSNDKRNKVASSGGSTSTSGVSGVVVWERLLPELADGIVDILPLSSGYSREAHGRLVLSTTPVGRGWANRQQDDKTSTTSATMKVMTTTTMTKTKPTVVNYCCQDNGVGAIRIGGGPRR